VLLVRFAIERNHVYVVPLTPPLSSGVLVARLELFFGSVRT